jgi:hypothetical protein
VHGDGCVAEVDYKADREVRQDAERAASAAVGSRGRVCVRLRDAVRLGRSAGVVLGRSSKSETRRRCSRSGATRGTRLR